MNIRKTKANMVKSLFVVIFLSTISLYYFKDIPWESKGYYNGMHYFENKNNGELYFTNGDIFLPITVEDEGIVVFMESLDSNLGTHQGSLEIYEMRGKNYIKGSLNKKIVYLIYQNGKSEKLFLSSTQKEINKVKKLSEEVMN